jgi:hypothetical protein
MTTSIVTPHAVHLETRASAVPDFAAKVAAAQGAGELAYEFAQRAGAPLVERAIAYHVAFADTMRELSSPLPCPCDLCTGGDA